MGGQTALNTALALSKDGTLDRLGVELIGANAAAIEMAEDRLKFREAMDRIGLESPRSAIAHSLEEALDGAGDGRPAGDHPPELHAWRDRRRHRLQPRGVRERSSAAGSKRRPTTEVLIEESVLGWKEYEMEVVRDRADNAIIICSIENIDPMGVHTGDSITVAPALTLTDKEYQRMRSASIAVLREIGVETGGSNVQFAVDPKTGRMVVIEMNPRVSRSSALASKATGFPIAKVAARLAVGYTLDEIANDITGGATPASFEPTIDYVVTKVPRFAFEKFKGAEAMLQHLDEVGRRGDGDRAHRSPRACRRRCAGSRSGCAGSTGCASWRMPTRRRSRARWRGRRPTGCWSPPRRCARVSRSSGSTQIAGFDPWFLERLKEIVEAEEQVRADGLPQRRRRDAAAEGDGLFRRAAGAAGDPLGARAARTERDRAARKSGIVHDALEGDDRRDHRGRGSGAPGEAWGAAGVQAHRQLRRRVRCGDALSLLDL